MVTTAIIQEGSVSHDLTDLNSSYIRHIVCQVSTTIFRVDLPFIGSPFGQVPPRSKLNRFPPQELGNPQNKVAPGVRVHNAAHLADLEAERSLLKWLLHHPRTKEVEVASLGEGAAVTPLLARGSELVHESLAREALESRFILLQFCVRIRDLGARGALVGAA